MNIFISYASEQRAVAEEIALALRGERHEVFLDRTALPEGDAYNARIREAIQRCDLLVFLISPEAVAPGRYTLTELRFAEEQWPSPAGHVLPVMVRPTEGAALPAYLRAVVLLRPAGNIPAEVVAAVHRLARPAWLRFARRAAVPLVALAVIGGGFATWRAVERWRGCEQAQRLLDEAKLQQGAGDFAAAWQRYAGGLAACPGSDEAARGQERLAMDWLENSRATSGKTTFTEIVATVQPVLSRAAVSRGNRRAADALAHLGWADFLRVREGQRGLDPANYYRQALQRDPDNAYAHAFLGHHTIATRGDAAQARAHFDRALESASSAQRPYLRVLQLSALMWRDDADTAYEAVRVASAMRAKGESMPAVAGDADTLVSGLWQIYHRALVRGQDRDAFLAALPAQDLLASYRWLFPKYDNSSNGAPYRFMLAQLQEHAGERAEALATYRSLLARMAGRESSYGRMGSATREAVARLQGR